MTIRHIDTGEYIQAQQERIERLQAELNNARLQYFDIFTDMWDLLDAVMQQADDTLWFDGETTAHEALCDIAAKYDVDLAAAMNQKLEDNQ